MKPCFQVSGENGERNSPAAAADEYPRYQSRAVPISCGAMRSIHDIFSPVVHLDLNFPANLCLTTFVLSLCTKCIRCSRNIHSFVVLPFLLRFSPAFLTTEIDFSVSQSGGKGGMVASALPAITSLSGSRGGGGSGYYTHLSVTCATISRH